MSSLFTSSSRYIAVVFASVVIFGALFVTAYACLPGPTPERFDQLWAASMWRAKERIASETEGPRILVFGGSDVYFGISGMLMTQMTGIPSFNMGTHGGNGVGLLLNDAVSFARSGDIAIIALLPTHLFHEKALVTSQAQGVDRWLGNRYFFTASLREKLLLLSHSKLVDVFTIRNSPPEINYQYGYWQLPPGEHGDIKPIYATDETTSRVLQQLEKLPDRDQGLGLRAPPTRSWALPDRLALPESYPALHPSIERSLKRAIRDMESRGVTPFFTLTATAFANTPYALTALVKTVGEERFLIGAEHLPIDAMYDTPFHPSAIGREMVSRKLASSLCQKIVCRDL